jgi:hypothetical protein
MLATTDVHDAVKRVEASAVFATFSAANPHHYLVHAFASVSGPDEAAALEIGYYGKETDEITVFSSEPVAMRAAEQVFKQPGKVLAPLDLAAVRVGLADALARAERERARDYPHHMPMRIICVLQQHEQPCWLLTIVTNTMQMLTVRLDATIGTVLSREMTSLMSLVKE